MNLYPTCTAKSVDDIPFDRLYEKGFRGIIFDIDNTLVRHGAPADDHAVLLFEMLRKVGFDTCLISNNKQPRVEPFARAVGSKAIWDAQKPSGKNYICACSLMGVDANQTLFVGDQLFTDIWGANCACICSILVKPIHPKEEIQIVLKRRLEAIVMFFYRRSGREKSMEEFLDEYKR